MPDGTCTGWFDGNWIDCCCQHDVDCSATGRQHCLHSDNWDLMKCVVASSYSPKVFCPTLVRANAVLMFVGVTVLSPVLFRIKSVYSERLINGRNRMA